MNQTCQVQPFDPVDTCCHCLQQQSGRLQQWQVLVFSYSTHMLDLLESILISRGYNFTRLDGSTKQKDRQREVRHKGNPDIPAAKC